MTVIYHSAYPKLITPTQQHTAYNRNDTDCVVIYYTKSLCLICETIVDDMNALLTDSRYETVHFYEASSDVYGNVEDPEFMDVVTYPTIKIFREYPLYGGPILPITSTPYVSTLTDTLDGLI